jgi:hypothetical protein
MTMAAHAVEHARLAQLGKHAVEAAQRTFVGVLEQRDRTGETRRDRRPGE